MKKTAQQLADNILEKIALEPRGLLGLKGLVPMGKKQLQKNENILRSFVTGKKPVPLDDVTGAIQSCALR
jgi:hypothetical protein